MLKIISALLFIGWLGSCAGNAPAEAKNTELEAQQLKAQSANFGSGAKPAQGLAPSFLNELQNFRCSEPNALKGVATSTLEYEAVGQAQHQLALQIQASVEGLTDSYRNSVRVDDQETISRHWSSQVRQMTNLTNAHEAKIEHIAQRDNMYGVVVCMSKDAAARPFVEQFAPLADSLQILMQTVMHQNHPLRKNQAWWEAQQIYARILPLRGVLETLGQSAGASLQNDYRAMVAHYTEFKSQFGMYWQGGSDAVSQAVFAPLASRYKLNSGTCAQGLSLQLSAVEVSCSPGALGNTCSWHPELTGTSCQGEVYFKLQGAVVRGIGKYEADARQELVNAVKTAAFWGEWLAELDQWGSR